uniref:Thioesterase domain-containing protein n=1 Tax=Noccaea caerulescens TaxID=107243 RepID=A0A1J3K355_NOCCA
MSSSPPLSSETAAIPSPVSSKTTTASKEIDANSVLKVADFFKAIAYPDSDPSVDEYLSFDSFSVLFQNNIRALSVARGRISCSVIVTPPIANFFNGLHGGAVASIAERLTTACARTVVSEDKQLFLGELSMSYLSAAPISSELLVEGTVVRSGRNLTVVNVEFKMKDTMKVTYFARATFYHTIVSKL